MSKESRIWCRLNSINLEKKYWYSIDIYECVICGKQTKYKGRVYNENDKKTIHHQSACSEHF